MPAKSKYPEAELVQRLMENWARWPGWAGHVGARSTLAWLDDFVSNKRQGDYAPSIPVMGGEAADTHRALGAMRHDLAQALIVHYTWRGTASEKLAELFKKQGVEISKRTFFYRVGDAHPEFMGKYREHRMLAHASSAGNAASTVSAGPAVARRHRLVVTPKLALKSAEKPSDIKANAPVDENGK
jgi:hypothetical protein